MKNSTHHATAKSGYLALQSLLPGNGDPLDWSRCCQLIPSLARLEATPQDPVHHAEGNVGLHTRMVIHSLRQSPYFAQAAFERQWVMFMAALLHDIAKPDTTVIDPVSGRISQPGHSRRGSVDARLLLWQAGVPVALREAICRIIAVHQVPFFVFDNRKGQAPEYTARKLSWELCVAELVTVARADMQGRVCATQSQHLQDIDLFEVLARDEGAWEAPRKFADRHTALAYFRGAELFPDAALFQRPGSHVTVMCGLPASGKNTWVSQHRPGLPVVSFDDAREDLGLSHGKNEGMVAHRTHDDARHWLRQKQDFVWNATHLSLQMRSKTLELLYAYDAQVEIVHLEQPLPELLRRNQQRDTTLSNAKLLKMLTRWEAPLPTEAHEVVFWESE